MAHPAPLIGVRDMRSLWITDICFVVLLSALVLCPLSATIASADDQADLYSRKGFAFFQDKEYGQAINEYSKAIGANKTDSKYYYFRGVAYLMYGQHEKALGDFSEAVQIDPRFADAYSAAASIFLTEGQYRLAIEFYSRAISLNPSDTPDLLFSRGVSYKRMNDEESAAADFQAACKQGSEVGCLFWNAVAGLSL